MLELLLFLALIFRLPEVSLDDPPPLDEIKVDLSTGKETLRVALDEQRGTDRPLRIVLSGCVSFNSPIRIGPGNSGVTLTRATDRPCTLTGGGKVRRAIEIVRSDNVVVDGLHLSGFSSDGVFVKDSEKVVLRNNVVTDTRSTRWSQAAIHLTGSVSGSLVANNTVAGADYGGILVDTTSDSAISGVRILNNHVEDTCRRVADCGAIYVNDRARRSKGIVIERNQITGFGPPAAAGRGIYLDDWASHVLVRHNRIAGPGVFAFQIHGGHHNSIEHNVVNMKAIREAVLYHPTRDGKWEDMNDNRIAYNRFDDGPAGNRGMFGGRPVLTVAQPLLRGNRACISRCVALR